MLIEMKFPTIYIVSLVIYIKFNIITFNTTLMWHLRKTTGISGIGIEHPL